MTPQTFETAFERVRQLTADFQTHEKAYLAPEYKEDSVRKDFIDKFWIALGWDVYHEQQTNPYEQEVVAEKNVEVKGRIKKADYAFIASNFRDVRFFVEAKKPSRNIDNADDYFQTIRYGWNARASVSILTDFQHWRVLDCRDKPDVTTALNRVIKKFHYTEYAEREKFAEIYHLFSREAISGGALEKFAETLPRRAAGKGRQRGLSGSGYKSVDEDFLAELDDLRDELARSFKNRNPHLGGEDLTEATQRTIDRLVFMRFLEDKLIEPETIVERLGERGTVWGDFVSESQRLDRIYNGIIFKRHAIIDDANFVVDERMFAGVRERLSHTNSPYDFNSLPVAILGSIYERFLGKVIVTTDKRASVVEKPEVRKAGGVYYTPEYIVRYIVKETVGKLIAGKTPAEIAKMRFADIACGSGSFLLGVYDELLRYHTGYYNRTKRRRAEALRAGCVEREDGSLALSLIAKREILLNNIYGVDIDTQATEVAQLSLFLKLLEDETPATARQQMTLKHALLPNLNSNIRCGNSLVGYDILDGHLFEPTEERNLNPMDFEAAFPEVMRAGGFDCVVGNPPYIRIQTLQETSPRTVKYLKDNYTAASKGNYDIYVVFIERALQLLRENGRLGYIVPHKFFNAQYGAPVRQVLAHGKHLSHVVHFGDAQVFTGATTYTCLLFADNAAGEAMRFVRAKDLSAWQEHAAGDEGTISTANITANEWNFTIGEGAGLFEKLSAMPTRLGDVANLFVGLQTDADDVYILEQVEVKGSKVLCSSKHTKQTHWFENDHLKPFLKGSLNIRRYEFSNASKRLLFPYENRDEKSFLILPNDYKNRFPLTWAYLEECKIRLTKRNKGQMKHDWYGYVYKKNHTKFGITKLVVPSLATGSCFAFDAEGKFYFVGSGGGGGGGYGIALIDTESLSYLYLLGVLNSKLISSFLQSISTPFRGGYIALNRQYIEQLPIRTINFADHADCARHDRMVSLVEAMLAAKKQLQSARTDRDQTFYTNKCRALDRQIDNLVYELYNLTPEEIRLVETS